MPDGVLVIEFEAAEPPAPPDNETVSIAKRAPHRPPWADATTWRAIRPWIGRTILRAPLTGRAWLEALYLLIRAVLSIPEFFLIAGLLVFGGLLTVSLVGIVPGLLVLIVAVQLARWLGSLHRHLAGLLLSERITAPPRRRQGRGLLGRVDAVLLDPVGWRSVSYLLLQLPVALVGGYVLVTYWLGGLINLASPLWWLLAGGPPGGGQTIGIATGFPFNRLASSLDPHLNSWPWTLLVATFGVIALLLAPWLTRAVTIGDRWLARNLLGSGSLAARVRDLEEKRALAVDDSAAMLRRVERDLHDGAQARLAALAMSLGLAKEKLGSSGPPADIARARELVDAAHHNAKEALTELRDLARGIHPPVLDAGLAEALTTLAARSAVPVELTTDLPLRPTPAIETIVYFCAAELLANATKHGSPRLVTIEVTEPGETVRLRVTDDGHGGANPDRGTGLRGLAERVRTVDGSLDIASPDGGPTEIIVRLPLHA